MKQLREVKIVLYVEFEGEKSSYEITWLAANELKRQIAEKVIIFDVYQKNDNSFKKIGICLEKGGSLLCQ